MSAAVARHFEVGQDDLRRCRLHESPLGELADGEALLRSERFALTANNITYGVFGAAMQYWSFFPAEKGWGRIPVWGHATVEASRAAGIEPGQRYYGYLPMSSHLVVKPDKISAGGFQDASAHRKPLPATYQLYRRAADAPDAPAREAEDRRALLWPLFITSFLIEDFLSEMQLWGARQVVIASASSKTALGLAHRLALVRPQSCAVIGMTSPRNRAFCESLGSYDRVVAYDALESLPADVPTVYVDMAGDGAVLARVHNHWREQLRHSCIVGATHWEQRATQHALPGAKPEFFFAPTRIRKRAQDWGPQGMEREFGNAWAQFAPSLDGWLRVQRSADVEAVYREVLEGRASPQDGHVVAWGS